MLSFRKQELLVKADATNALPVLDDVEQRQKLDIIELLIRIIISYGVLSYVLMIF
jgi:hypothetical protein